METIKFIKGEELLNSGFTGGIVIERNLTGRNPLYSVFVAGKTKFPTGKLFVEVRGDIVPENEYAVIENNHNPIDK